MNLHGRNQKYSRVWYLWASEICCSLKLNLRTVGPWQRNTPSTQCHWSFLKQYIWRGLSIWTFCAVSCLTLNLTSKGVVYKKQETHLFYHQLKQSPSKKFFCQHFSEKLAAETWASGSFCGENNQIAVMDASSVQIKPFKGEDIYNT